VGSTVTKFRLRFNNHKARIRRHERLNGTQKENDDFLYKHFSEDGHNGLRDVKIQLIDRVNGEEELRDKEGQWAYKLNTLRPYGLNDNDFILHSEQAFKMHVTYRVLVISPACAYAKVDTFKSRMTRAVVTAHLP